MQHKKAVDIAAGVRWVGALDPDLRIFDVVMRTEKGTSYNSYLVEGSQKKALVDVVKGGFGPEYLATLATLVDLKTIDYIVINHTEPDHSGALADVLQAAPQATVVCSKFAQGLLRQIINADFPCQVVRDGDTIDLGGKTLRFIPAPFLHWPDSMFTYLLEDDIIFTGDVFGCHYCDERLFDDLIDTDFLPEQRFYFDVIMSPFKEHMVRAIAKIKDLPIKTVCPSHGPILRGSAQAAIAQTEGWSAVPPADEVKRVFIGYVSAYGNTRRLAEAIGQAAADAGCVVTTMDVSQRSMADIMSAINSADVVAFGSPTVNRDALKPVWDVLTNLSPIVHKGKTAGAFGSYGWSGEAVANMEERLKSVGMKVVQPGYQTKLTPDAAAINAAYDFGSSLVRAVTALSKKDATNPRVV